MSSCTFHNDTFSVGNVHWSPHKYTDAGSERWLLKDHSTGKNHLPPSAPFNSLPISSNWSLVALSKRKWDGALQPSWFVKDHASGDLYLPETTQVVAIKCMALAFGTIFYIPALMVINAAKIFTDVANIALRTLMEFGQNWKQRGPVEAFATIFFAVTWEAPATVFGDICRIAKAPLHGMGMIYAGLYGIFSPYEGRKWFARIERSLHEGATIKDDLRYYPMVKGTTAEEIADVWNRLQSGNILFSGFCMQPIGNLRDKASHLNRFERI